MFGEGWGASETVGERASGVFWSYGNDIALIIVPVLTTPGKRYLCGDNLPVRGQSKMIVHPGQKSVVINFKFRGDSRERRIRSGTVGPAVFEAAEQLLRHSHRNAATQLVGRGLIIGTVIE
jgi:hypothetical protein